MMKWKILLILICLQLPSFAAWFHTGWQYRAKVTTQNGKVDADLTDYPIYIKLDDLGSGHGFWTNVLSTGADIRVTKTDGTTEVPLELVVIDTSAKTGELHFKASGTLSGTSNADYYIYYGNGDAAAYAASATYGANNVWTSYSTVFHLQQDPSGGAPQMTNSKAAYHGTSAGSMTNSDLVVGRLGKALDLDGSNDRITFNDTGNSADNNTRTISFWVYAGATHNDWAGHASYGTSSQFDGWSVIYNEATNNLKVATNGGNSLTASTGSISASTWTKVDVTYNSTTLTYYLSGAASGTSLFAIAPTTILNSGYIGSSPWGDYYTGIIDEVRYTTTALTSTWISTEYNNQNSPSTFYTLAAQEAQPAATNNSIFFGVLF